MYSTCIHCHAKLGANESIEHFPVGRRLAFDAARGRLWVVCRRCGRWNLSPLEERWEAIEECERAPLERDWEAEEEIAAIADNLLIPASVRELLARHGRAAQNEAV